MIKRPKKLNAPRYLSDIEHLKIVRIHNKHIFEDGEKENKYKIYLQTKW